jgi:hypothetical protein
MPFVPDACHLNSCVPSCLPALARNLSHHPYTLENCAMFHAPLSMACSDDHFRATKSRQLVTTKRFVVHQLMITQNANGDLLT